MLSCIGRLIDDAFRPVARDVAVGPFSCLQGFKKVYKKIEEGHVKKYYDTKKNKKHHDKKSQGKKYSAGKKGKKHSAKKHKVRYIFHVEYYELEKTKAKSKSKGKNSKYSFFLCV
jgi:hypothetical protein